MAFAIGAPFGILFSAWATSFYVDFNRIPANKIPDNIPQEDPRWIGAWWLGLVVCFVCLVAVGIPMGLYPRSMREYKEREIDHEKVEKGSEDERRRSRQRSRGSSIFEQTTKVKGTKVLRITCSIITYDTYTRSGYGVLVEYKLVRFPDLRYVGCGSIHTITSDFRFS